MKVGIDISPLNSGHQKRGVGYYTRYLVESLQKVSGLKIVEFLDINELADVDLIHYPYLDFFKPTLPLIKKVPTVVTIHDLIPILFPKHYPSGIKGKINLFRQKLALKNVSAVISVSNSTKKDIEKNLDIEPDKIFTVYSAPSENFKKVNTSKLKEVKEKLNLPEKFALYVGNVNWNKNLLNLTKGCLATGIDLYLIGSGFETKENLDHPELKSFKEWLEKYSNSPKIHILGFVSDDNLVSLYNLAQVLLSPSYYEGFDLPILEAQACGCPVITSNTSSMPEIAGEGALFVNPEDSKDIAGAIEKVVKDDGLRNNLVKKGFENVEKYSWEKTALETIKVYEKSS